MTVYSVRAIYKGDTREHPIVIAYVRTDQQRKATMWAMNCEKPRRAVRIDVRKSDWFDRFMVWLDLLPVHDV